MNEVKYMSFGLRVVASLVDCILLMLVLSPIVSLFLERENLQILLNDYYLNPDVSKIGAIYMLLLQRMALSFLLMALIVIPLWKWKLATPGKMIFSAKIVDEKTLGKPTNTQWIIRFLSALLSCLPLGLGLLWVIWDKRKQAWHDKFARVVVIIDKNEK
ncbi:MAG: RDD family protein [Verrucomicrobiota bacterium]